MMVVEIEEGWRLQSNRSGNRVYAYDKNDRLLGDFPIESGRDLKHRWGSVWYHLDGEKIYELEYIVMHNHMFAEKWDIQRDIIYYWNLDDNDKRIPESVSSMDITLNDYKYRFRQ